MIAAVPQVDEPTLDEVRATRERIGARVVRTPVRQLVDDGFAAIVGADTAVFLKEELFQRTGSFKPRGALSVMLDLDGPALARGVTAVSAGNHALAVAYAARALGTTAKVVMPKNANAFRVQGCRALGAEVELVDDVHKAFERVREIQEAEGRSFVHPFEGPKTALGTATVLLVYFIGRRRSEATGLIAALLLAVFGQHVRESHGHFTFHRMHDLGADLRPALDQRLPEHAVLRDQVHDGRRLAAVHPDQMPRRRLAHIPHQQMIHEDADVARLAARQRLRVRGRARRHGTAVQAM